MKIQLGARRLSSGWKERGERTRRALKRRNASMKKRGKKARGEEGDEPAAFARRFRIRRSQRKLTPLAACPRATKLCARMLRAHQLCARKQRARVWRVVRTPHAERYEATFPCSNRARPSLCVRIQKTRLGRGIGSGKGKTSGRGHGGQKARQGSGKPRVSFEGGQTPIYKRIPKSGFTNTPYACMARASARESR